MDRPRYTLLLKKRSAEHAALLISYGAKLHVKDRKGKRTIDTADEFGNVGVQQVILSMLDAMESHDRPRRTPVYQPYLQRIMVLWGVGRSPQLYYSGLACNDLPKFVASDLNEVEELHFQQHNRQDLLFQELLDEQKVGLHDDLDSADDCSADEVRDDVTKEKGEKCDADDE